MSEAKTTEPITVIRAALVLLARDDATAWAAGEFTHIRISTEEDYIERHALAESCFADLQRDGFVESALNWGGGFATIVQISQAGRDHLAALIEEDNRVAAKSILVRYLPEHAEYHFVGRSSQLRDGVNVPVWVFQPGAYAVALDTGTVMPYHRPGL